MCQDIPLYPYTYIYAFVNSLCPFTDFHMLDFGQIQHGRIAALAIRYGGIQYGRIATRQTV